jgi:hypothetical protein
MALDRLIPIFKLFLRMRAGRLIVFKVVRPVVPLGCRELGMRFGVPYRGPLQRVNLLVEESPQGLPFRNSVIHSPVVVKLYTLALRVKTSSVVALGYSERAHFATFAVGGKTLGIAKELVFLGVMELLPLCCPSLGDSGVRAFREHVVMEEFRDELLTVFPTDVGVHFVKGVAEIGTAAKRLACQTFGVL